MMDELERIITKALEMVQIQASLVIAKNARDDSISWAISPKSIKLIAPELAKQIRKAGYVKAPSAKFPPTPRPPIQNDPPRLPPILKPGEVLIPNVRF
jgi:hypothetical protein